MALTRAKSYMLLAYEFNMHMLKRYILRRRAGGFDEFQEYYRDDCLAPLSSDQRNTLPMMENCIACGECDPVCPVLLPLGRDVFEGPEALALNLSRNLPSAGLVPDAYKCTLCGACEDECPLDVPVPDIVRMVRSISVRIAPELVPKPVLLATELFNKTGRPYNITQSAQPETSPRNAETVYFVGCSELAEGELSGPKLLKQTGIDFAAFSELCCGGIPDDLGIEFNEQRPMAIIAQKLAAMKTKRLIASCSRCLVELSKSPELMDADIEVLSLEQTLVENTSIKPLNKPLTVAFHDSCMSGRMAGIYDEPRELLKKLGCEVREFTLNMEKAPCCGGGGFVLETEPDVAKSVARCRIDEAVSSLKVDAIVTTCAKCEKTFEASLEESEKLAVTTVAQLAAKAIGA